jgi:hypothetical protein
VWIFKGEVFAQPEQPAEAAGGEQAAAATAPAEATT